MQAIAEQTRIVRLPLNRLSSINKISKAMNYLEQQYEREPTNGELADYLEVDEELIATNNSIKNRQVSFDKPLNHDGESDFSLYDIVQTDDIPAPDKELISESVKINIQRALSKLNGKESEIISLFYGLNKQKVYSLHEIASRLGISSERVRQIRSSGLLKMKRLLSGKVSFLDTAQ